MLSPIDAEWSILTAIVISIIVLIWTSEKIRTLYRLPTDATRKFVHIFVGVLLFFSPYLFRSPYPLVAASILFVVLNAVGIRWGFFQGMHKTGDSTYGTVFYPLSFLILVLLFWPAHTIIIQISVLIMALADAGAAILGEAISNAKLYRVGSERKSIQGSLTMAILSFGIVLAVLRFLPDPIIRELTLARMIWIGLLTAIMATVLEAISWRGSDNITVPLGAAFVLHFTLTQSAGGNLQFSLGFILAALLAAASHRLGVLDAGGAIAAFVLGTAIFGIGGWAWGVPILAFFVSSSLLSRLWRERKSQANLSYEKSSRRDLAQVLANGGMAGLSILIYYATNAPYLYAAFLGTLAAVTADTWATEIGGLSKSPRLITTLSTVLPGTSGAVSIPGTSAAMLGGLFIASTGFLFGSFLFESSLAIVILITVGGFLGSFVDSILGATMQAQFRCTVCNKVTEKKVHCLGEKSVHIRGIRWINNDLVNTICALSGGLFVLLGLKVMNSF